MQTLRTPRLTLEPQVAGHADEMFGVLADPAIYEIENEPPASAAWLRERYTRLESRRSRDGREAWLNWVLRRADDGALIGYVQATVDGPRALVAYVLHSAHWGRGLAGEAVAAMIDHLAAAYGVSRLQAVLKRRNVRSLRLLGRLGFAPVASPGFEIEPDEVAMARDLGAAPPAPGACDTPPLFATPNFVCREIGLAEVPLLQALFDANPLYLRTVNGRVAHADEAQLEFDELPPPHLRFTRRWFLGLFDGSERLVGHVSVLSDLMATGIWHTGLFIVATHLHGSGAAAETYQALDRWMCASGARWLRLGVVRGNTRAERFWERQGYREVRLREGVDTGGRLNTVRVMVKDATGAGALADYLALAPRDEPGSTLA